MPFYPYLTPLNSRFSSSALGCFPPSFFDTVTKNTFRGAGASSCLPALFFGSSYTSLQTCLHPSLFRFPVFTHPFCSRHPPPASIPFPSHFPYPSRDPHPPFIGFPVLLFPPVFFSVRPRQPFTPVRLRLLFPPPLFLYPARSTLPSSLYFFRLSHPAFPSPSPLLLFFFLAFHISDR